MSKIQPDYGCLKRTSTPGPQAFSSDLKPRPGQEFCLEGGAPSADVSSFPKWQIFQGEFTDGLKP